MDCPICLESLLETTESIITTECTNNNYCWLVTDTKGILMYIIVYECLQYCYYLNKSIIQVYNMYIILRLFIQIVYSDICKRYIIYL